MPFETPRAVDVVQLRDRKIACANEILRQTTELEQIEFPRKLKLIGLWTGIILTALVATVVLVGGAIIGSGLLGGLIGGGVMVGIMLGIGSSIVGIGALVIIASLLKKLFEKGYEAIQKPKTDLIEARDQNIKEWHNHRVPANLQTTIKQIDEMLPSLERLRDPVLCQTLEQEHTEYEISQNFRFEYRKFLSNEMDASDFLSAIQKPDRLSQIFAQSNFYKHQKDMNFLSRLPENIQRYDQLQLRGAAMRAVIEPRNSSFESILGITVGYMGLVGTRPESVPLPDAS